MGRGSRLRPVELPRLIQKPGTHCDGQGLNLSVKSPGSGSWVLRYMIDGRPRTMGLGSYPAVSLSEAREKAIQARKLKIGGEDPIEVRKLERATKRLKDAKAFTFKQCAEAYIASHRDGWRNSKHADQWTNTLKTYAYPIIGDLPVAAIDSGLVMAVLEQPVGAPKCPERLWTAKNETASRVRGRIENVLGWAAARQLRTGDNPAVWKGNLEHQLPKRSKVAKVEHHAALPYDEIPAFMAALRKQRGLAAKALELTILTGARTGEVLGATWQEIDLKAKVWTIPAERMKAGRVHRIPLSEPIISLLEGLAPGENAAKAGPYVFPGAKPGRPLSNMAMLVLLKRMKRSELTTHGFRSTFRDWAAECTQHSREIAEMALAHTISNAVEAAYLRSDLIEKRRALSDDWAIFCCSAATPPNPKARKVIKAAVDNAIRKHKSKVAA